MKTTLIGQILQMTILKEEIVMIAAGVKATVTLVQATVASVEVIVVRKAGSA